MSIIRCLSNPEALYGIYTKDGRKLFVEFWAREGHLWIPARIFDTTVQRFDRDYDEPVSYQGFRIDEVQVFRGTRKLVTKRHLNKCCKDWLRNIKKKKKRCSHDYQIRWRWKGISVFMWRTTWEYIAHDVLRRRDWRKRPKRRKRK